MAHIPLEMRTPYIGGFLYLMFLQECATWCISHAIIDLMNQTFDGRSITRNGDVNWLPRSSDVTSNGV